MSVAPESVIYMIPVLLDTNSSFDYSLPLHIKSVIKNTRIFFVENIRSARRFVASLKIEDLIIDELTFYEISADFKTEALIEVLKKIKNEGLSAGVLSEAGCPGVADPGAAVAAEAHRLSVRVCPLPGPSSLLLSLMASGFNGQSFAFVGYLPVKPEERRKKIALLEKNALQQGQTQIFIETPYRNEQLLTDLLAVGKPQTKLCIAVSLTVPGQEYIVSKTLAEWKKSALPKLHKVPAIFLMAV